MFDDTDPQIKPAAPKVLDTLSLTELGEYIERLEAEISRVKTAIQQKKAHSEAAAAMFRQPLDQ